MRKQKCTAIPSLEQSVEQGRDNIILQRQLDKPKKKIKLQLVLLYSAERRIQVSLGNAATNENLFKLMK